MRRYFLFTRKEEANTIHAARKHSLDMAVHKKNNAQPVCKEALPVKPQEENIYEQLLAKGYSKQSIHTVLHHLVLEDLKLQRQYEKKSFAGKTAWHIKRFFHQHKLLRFLKHITAKGLYLLKTQWAKKPKQPV